MDYPSIIPPYELSKYFIAIGIIQLLTYYYMGIAVSQYKDPYEPISSHGMSLVGFERCSDEFLQVLSDNTTCDLWLSGLRKLAEGKQLPLFHFDKALWDQDDEAYSWWKWIVHELLYIVIYIHIILYLYLNHIKWHSIYTLSISKGCWLAIDPQKWYSRSSFSGQGKFALCCQGYLWSAYHWVEACAISGNPTRRRDDRTSGVSIAKAAVSWMDFPLLGTNISPEKSNAWRWFSGSQGWDMFFVPWRVCWEILVNLSFPLFQITSWTNSILNLPGANFQVLDTANLKNSWAPQQKIRSKHVPGQIHMRPGSSRTTHPKWWWWFSKGSVPQNALKTFRFRNYSKLPRCTANRCFFNSKSSKMWRKNKKRTVGPGASLKKVNLWGWRESPQRLMCFCCDKNWIM